MLVTVSGGGAVVSGGAVVVAAAVVGAGVTVVDVVLVGRWGDTARGADAETSVDRRSRTRMPRPSPTPTTIPMPIVARTLCRPTAFDDGRCGPVAPGGPCDSTVRHVVRFGIDQSPRRARATSRAASRSASRRAMSCRLSTVLRPLPRANSTLRRPSLK